MSNAPRIPADTFFPFYWCPVVYEAYTEMDNDFDAKLGELSNAVRLPA